MDGHTMNPLKHVGPRGAESRRRLPATSKYAVCTACRQSKVRCSGSQDGACERCVKLELDCHRDPGFKRVSKTRKIAELEKQVQSLASAMKRGHSFQTSQFQHTLPLGGVQRTRSAEYIISGPISTFETTIGQQHQLGSPLPRLQTSDHLSVSKSPINGPVNSTLSDPIVVRPPAIMPQILEGVQFSTVQIDLLFQTFFEHYHHFLPFLDPSKSPDEYYKSGISLFWAIIGVASRRYREDITLLHALSDRVMKYTWAEISNPPYKVSTLQSLIVLCIWPFPTTTTYKDVSVTLSSIAISASMLVGLYMPFNTQDFSLGTKSSVSAINEMDSDVLTRTWAVANIVSQTSGAVVGQLPNAPFDWTIDRACELGNMYTLPDELRLKLIIQRYCHRVTKTMWNISYDPITVHLTDRHSPFTESWGNDITMLENELDSLETESAGLFSTMDRLYLAAARLYLHSFYFFDTSTTESRKQGILKAYTSAVNLVSLFMSVDATGEELLYLPHYHSRMLLTATCIVLKVLKSSYAPELGDAAQGRKTFNECILTLSRCSVSNNDTCGKAVKLVSQMWHRGGVSKGQSPPELTIKSRCGASIIYDFIWSWRKEFGGLSRTKSGLSNEVPPQEPSAAQFPSTFEEGSMFNLDFLDDPGWNLGLAESLMFSPTEA